MSATPETTVGVAGAPEVAAALREIGWTVITGKTFREAAIAIAAQLSKAPIPVVVETLTEAGFTPWVSKTHSRSAGVILLPTNDAVDLTGELARIPQLALPATVNDLLVKMDAAPALAAAGEVRIEAHSVSAPTAPARVPVATPEVVQAPVPVATPEVVQAPVPVAAPVVAPVPAPVPAPVDDFTAMMAEASGPAVTDPFVAAAVTDPFDASASAAAPVDSFDAMLAAVPTPELTPELVAPVAELGVANPVTPQVSAVVDPYAASSISGADDAGEEPAVVDDFLASIEQHAVVEAPQIAPAFEPAPVAVIPEPAPVAFIPEPVPVQAAEPVTFIPEPVPVVIPEPVPAPEVFAPAPAPVPAPAPQVIPEPIAPERYAPAAPQSDFITNVLARKQLTDDRPVWEQAPAPASSLDASGFFGGPGISTGGCQVIISLAGKGGAGKTTQTLMYGQTAGDAGLRVLVVDANRDQGDIGTSLRIEKAGLPTILQSIQGQPGDAIVSQARVNDARPSGAQEIHFDVVLAPPREFAGPRYASAQVYARLLAYAKTRYDVIVIDTQIVEAQKSDLHTGFIIPELRSGAWSAGIALYDYSAIRNAFAVFDELAALGVTQQRTLVVATRWPEKEADAERFRAQFGQFGTFVGFVGDDPNVNAQKSVGNLLIGSPAIAPVVRTLLHRVTNNDAFAPIEDAGRRKRKKDTAPTGPKKERRGLFGGRR